ncbi:MAG TPA: hypothetical protein EYH46_07930 [Sulfurivirga caldicuralii]|nr:hypothetical protein [Sulfurivirga caldicuralii]
MMKKILLFSLSLFFLPVYGEHSTVVPEKGQAYLPDINKVQASLVYDHILPNIRSFLIAAKDLKATANEFCHTKTEKKLAELQEKFKTLSVRWHRIEMLNFGPLNDDIFLPKRDAINYPINNTSLSYPRSFVAKHLNATSGIDFSSLSPREKGLLMLEVLLFETAVSNDKQLEKIVEDYKKNLGKCYLLKGFSELIESDAQYIDDGWNIKYRQSTKPFKDIYLSGTLPDGSDSLVTLISEIQKYLEYIKKRNVISMTAPLSGISYDNAFSVINSIESLLEGVPGKTSFFSIIEAAGKKSVVDLVRENISDAKQALSVKDNSAYNAAVGRLAANFKRDLAESLGINLGLNFADGD